MFLVKLFLIFEFYDQNFYDVCNNLYNCDFSLLIVSGGFDDYGFVEFVECFDEETNEWKEVAETENYFNQLLVSYQPCIPGISENFPF